MKQAAGVTSIDAWVDMAALKQFLPEDPSIIAAFLQQVAMEGGRDLAVAQRLLGKGDRQGFASQVHRLCGSCQILKMALITDELLQLEAMIEAGVESAILQMRLIAVKDHFGDFTQAVQLMMPLTSYRS